MRVLLTILNNYVRDCISIVFQKFITLSLSQFPLKPILTLLDQNELGDSYHDRDVDMESLENELLC